MAKSPPPPELAQAYNLLKQGQKPQAGKLLKGYLAAHPQDVTAWWLMSHAVAKPENARRCLETVLKYDPDHEKARKRLARLNASAEPSDSMVLGVKTPPPTRKLPPVPAPVAAPPQAAPAPDPEPAGSGSPASFESYLAQQSDPFAAPPVDDPFDGVPSDAPAANEAESSGGAWNPFDSASQFDPSAAARMGRSESVAQAAGTGSQPDWGPGLAFVSDSAPSIPTPTLDVGKKKRGFDPDDFALDETAEKKPAFEAWIGYGLIAVAVVVLLGLIAYVAMSRGGNDVPAMKALDATTFTVEYPKGWDMRCESERRGYPVCGMANHPYYNNVDIYVGNEIDIGSMMADIFSAGSLFGGGPDLPDDMISVVIMDVPTNSPAYDNGSWAKTKWEWVQQGWYWYDTDDVDYQSQTRPPREVNGREAYYYAFNASSKLYGQDIAYDVYIPHDDIMLWMTVAISSPKRNKNYDDMVQAMIDSISIKPVDEWQ